MLKKSVTGKISLEDHQVIRDFAASTGLSITTFVENMLHGFAETLRHTREKPGKSGAFCPHGDLPTQGGGGHTHEGD